MLQCSDNHCVFLHKNTLGKKHQWAKLEAIIAVTCFMLRKFLQSNSEATFTKIERTLTEVILAKASLLSWRHGTPHPERPGKIGFGCFLVGMEN